MARITELCLVLLSSSLAPAAPVCERWAGSVPATHAGTLAIAEAGSSIELAFDLSALPREAAIRGAWLALEKEGDQPQEPLSVSCAGTKLRLEPPWYRRFVATEAARAWARDRATRIAFTVARFEGFRPAKAWLDILYEGESRGVPPQVEGVRAVHHGGQTFIVWTEHPAFRPDPGEIFWVEKFSEKGDVRAREPGSGAAGMPRHPAIALRTLRRLQGLALRDKPSGFQGIRDLERARRIEPVAYRVYRHTERIEASNIDRAELLAEVEPLGGYDGDVYRIHFQGEYIDQREEPESIIPTFRIGGGEALAPGQGLYVHTPKAAGAAYYAVTAVLGGTENCAQIAESNSVAASIAETPATPQPILQWIQQDQYHEDPPECWYRFWAAPPYVNVPSRSFRVAVAASDKAKGPRPLVVETISGTFNVRESLNLPRADRVTIAIEQELPWLPELFYNEGKGTLRGKSECAVDYYCERFMNLMISWVMGRYEIDRSRITGNLLYFGLRHPEIFPWMSFGGYTATYDYRWAPGDPDHLGPKGIRTVDGEDAWDMYSVGGYVLKYPDRDIPFMICISGTGKDSGHTSEFGWQDDPRGWAALERARQPFVAVWSGGDYGALRRLGDLRWEGSIPAFSNCSLDNNPGNGDPADGDYYGQINGYLLWDDATVVDEPDRWEMTVFLTPDCPQPACTVDITPRHCRRFKPRPGAAFSWTNTSFATGDRVGSGRIAADRWGLVTVERVRVDKGKNRVALSATAP